MTRSSDPAAPRTDAARYLDHWEAHLSLIATAAVRAPTPAPETPPAADPARR